MQERGTPAGELLADLDERRGRDPDVHGARLFGLTYPTGRADARGPRPRGVLAVPLRQCAEPVQVRRARRARGRRARRRRRPRQPPRGRRRHDDVGRHRVDPDVDAREPRAGAGPRRRTPPDRRRGVGAPRVREGGALLRHGRSCSSRSTTTIEPTSRPPPSSSTTTRPSSSPRRSRTRTASWTR